MPVCFPEKLEETLHVHIAVWKNLANHSGVAPQVHGHAQFRPSDPDLVVRTKKIGLQFAVGTMFEPPKKPSPHRLPVQKSLHPMMKGNFCNVSGQCSPVRTTTNSGPTLYLRDVNMRSSFVPSVQDFIPLESSPNMCCGGPIMFRQKLRELKWNNKKIQALYVFLVHGTMPSCKVAADETTTAK